MEHRGRGPVAQDLMGSLVVVEPKGVVKSPLGLEDVGAGLQLHLVVRHRPPQPLHEDMPEYRPFPSILILTPRSCRTAVNAQLVNWRHWSVLKTIGWPLPGASSSTPAQEPFSRVLDSFHAPAVPVHDRHQVEKLFGPRAGRCVAHT